MKNRRGELSQVNVAGVKQVVTSRFVVKIRCQSLFRYETRRSRPRRSRIVIVPSANTGTNNPTRNEPLCAESSPVIQGRTAPPSPEMAKIHFDPGESCMSVRTLARQRGKIGASIKPANMALRTIASGARLTSSSRMLMNAIVSDDVRSCASDNHRTIAGTSVRPQRSATQKQDAAIGAHALPEIGGTWPTSS